MEGIIKNYNEQRGFGFIKTNQGKDVFFHITNWQSEELPQSNMLVSYSVEESEGKTFAVNVKLMRKKQGVIVLGNNRIKISNIKSYGIDYEPILHQRIHKSFDEICEDNENADWVVISDQGNYIDSTQRLLKSREYFNDPDLIYKSGVKYYDDKGNICKYIPSLIEIIFNSVKNKNLINYNIKKDFQFLEVPCLYIITYQGDNYRYNQLDCNFDVFEKVKEIDSNM